MDESQVFLFDAFLTLQTREECREFLQDLLTPAELGHITKRLQMLRLLNNGLPQREVASLLHISTTTVSRAAQVSRSGTGRWRLVLEKLQVLNSTVSCSVASGAHDEQVETDAADSPKQTQSSS